MNDSAHGLRTSVLSLFCDRALEAGWLLGVTITPVFFNVYSSRVFEPDKLTTLRTLALVMSVLWLVRLVESLLHGQRPLRFSWRTPMVLAALLTMVLYLISSIFSLVPYTSFIGSYQRLQGTYTLFGYLVIFFAMLTGLRTRAQLGRLMTVLILNSLPISLYGIIQRKGWDPLPWAGNVQRRVASNMGNAIFVAAYLIMIVPLTAARIVQSFNDILSREEARISDILRAAGYIFLLAVQLWTIWLSKSRGPWLGLVAAGFLFPYLTLIILQRRALIEEETPAPPWFMQVLYGIGFGLGTLGLAAFLTLLGILAFDGSLGVGIGGGVGALVFGALWLYFIVERKGWRWLWISWGTVGLAVALALVAINVPGPLQDMARANSSLNRLARITEFETGTGKVRVLIWEGAIELVSFHDPIQFPDGSRDRFNILRPLLGYGPESMYVAYNSFYPAELGHYESRTASPDRSHNETLDAIVITGILGLGIYLYTFGSVFYWGFRWLNLLDSKGQLLLYIGSSVFLAVAFFIIGLQIGGLYLFAIAIPLGFMAGTMVYLTLQALNMLFRGARIYEALKNSSNAVLEPHPHTLLLIAILAVVMGHFVEINFGIAIAATRTTFWALAAVLVVLGLEWIPKKEGAELFVSSTQSDVPEHRPRNSERSRRRGTKRPSKSRPKSVPRKGMPAWLSAVLALSFLAVFLLGSLAYDFTNNPDRLTDASQILAQSLMRFRNENRYNPLPILFLFTWGLFGLVGLCELDRDGFFEVERSKRWGIAILLYGGISLVGLLIFGGFFAGLQARLPAIVPQTLEDVVNVAMLLAGVLGRYYVLIFVCLILIGGVLTMGTQLPHVWVEPLSLILLLVGLMLSVVMIRYTNYDLIRADIVYKQGGVFANSKSINDKQIGIAHYEKAIELTRDREDYYYLFLGKAYLELTQGLPNDIDPAQREALFAKTEEVLTQAREINPLNTDHSANLARFYKSWASREEGDKRHELLLKSLENYKTALTLSPQNPIIWNEMAMLHAFDLKNEVAFQETISDSLRVDPEFEQTWMLLGDVRSSKGDVEGAIQAYQEALKIKKDCNVYHVLGTLQAQQSSWDAAIATLKEATEWKRCANSRQLWDMYRVLAIAYANQGEQGQALQSAMQGLELAPEGQQELMQDLVASLQGQPVPAASEDAVPSEGATP
jgi:tetratricopeptide (TPR) repeat protein